jgi:two-component system, OmpR family, response regulator
MTTPRLPASLALIDDDPEYSQYLAQHLRGLGIAVQVYGDSQLLLTCPEAYSHAFYLVDLSLPGIDGVELIRLLRLRTQAGVLVVSGRLAPDAFGPSVRAGADMVLAKPVQFEQVALAIEAVHRRSPLGRTQDEAPWRLDLGCAQLVAPDGACIGLSETDRKLLDRFVEAQGDVVSREELLRCLGHAPDLQHDPLNATIFRLRRRIERATPLPQPLQARPKQGYVFRAPLESKPSLS